MTQSVDQANSPLWTESNFTHPMPFYSFPENSLPFPSLGTQNAIPHFQYPNSSAPQGVWFPVMQAMVPPGFAPPPPFQDIRHQSNLHYPTGSFVPIYPLPYSPNYVHTPNQMYFTHTGPNAASMASTQFPDPFELTGQSVEMQVITRKNEPFALETQKFENKSNPTQQFQNAPADNAAMLRCKKCQYYYRREENSENSCRYHPGKRGPVFTGLYTGWTCCKDVNREAPGCTVGAHIECVTTSAALDEVSKIKDMYTKNLYPSLEVPTEDLIDLNFHMEGDGNQGNDEVKNEEKNEEKKRTAKQVVHASQLVTSEDGSCLIKHFVQKTDTLVGIELKYNVPKEEIKAVNRLFKDSDLWGRIFIFVPFKGQDVDEETEEEKSKREDEMRKCMIRRFSKLNKCSSEESRYYLEFCEYNFGSAVEELQKDRMWERNNPKPQRMSMKV